MQDNDTLGRARGVVVCRQVIHPLLVVVAAFCLISLIGWTGRVNDWQHVTILLASTVFAGQRFLVYFTLREKGRERRRLAYHAVFATLVLVTAIWLAFRPVADSGTREMVGYISLLLMILSVGISSMIHHQTRFTAKAFHPGAVLMGSFLIIIIAGTLLLKMPRATVPGQVCSWLDALFTSTSAVCVTGLAVQNTATFFSPTGQAIILLLIQIGGLGIMTLTFFAAVVLFEGLSLHDRLLLGKMIQENRLARIGRTLGIIVGLTLVSEAIGAVVLYFTLDGFPNSGERLFHSVFHSISAFCNAGFSTLPDGLASTAVMGNATWQICIMALIVIGGLGAMPFEDLSGWCVARVKRCFNKDVVVPRLRVHTRLVIAVTGFLVVGGAAVFLITEFVLWNGPENGGKVLTATFHSVTARTAGFNTVIMSHIGPLTVQFLILLMLVGGSPGGTAGGLRTTVVFVGLGYLWSQLRESKRGFVIFRRTIPRETGAQALGLIVLAVIWLTVNFIALQVIQAGSGIPETSLLFELVSAFATVGLSLDLTPGLTDGAKALLILNMFVGRIGLLTVVSTLIPPDRRPASGKPTEDILLT